MPDRASKLHLCVELDAQLSDLKLELNISCRVRLSFVLQVRLSAGMNYVALTEYIWDDLDPSRDLERLWP